MFIFRKKAHHPLTRALIQLANHHALPEFALSLGFFFVLFFAMRGYFQSQTLRLQPAESQSLLSQELQNFSEFQPLTIAFGDTIIPVEHFSLGDGQWRIPSAAAGYITESGVPGFPGNVVLYGHNNRAVFGFFPSVRSGDRFQLLLSNQHIREYEVFETLVTDPSDVSVLSPSEQEIVTMYTCTGLFDRQRLVLRARPIE